VTGQTLSRAARSKDDPLPTNARLKGVLFARIPLPFNPAFIYPFHPSIGPPTPHDCRRFINHRRPTLAMFRPCQTQTSSTEPTSWHQHCPLSRRFAAETRAFCDPCSCQRSPTTPPVPFVPRRAPTLAVVRTCCVCFRRPIFYHLRRRIVTLAARSPAPPDSSRRHVLHPTSPLAHANGIFPWDHTWSGRQPRKDRF